MAAARYVNRTACRACTASTSGLNAPPPARTRGASPVDQVGRLDASPTARSLVSARDVSACTAWSCQTWAAMASTPSSAAVRSSGGSA